MHAITLTILDDMVNKRMEYMLFPNVRCSMIVKSRWGCQQLDGYIVGLIILAPHQT